MLRISADGLSFSVESLFSLAGSFGATEAACDALVYSLETAAAAVPFLAALAFLAITCF